MVEAGIRLKVDISASIPLPHLAHPLIEPLADPDLRAAYLRHLGRAGMAIWEGQAA